MTDRPGREDPPGVARTTALYAGAFLVAPNVVFWILGLVLYLVRPPVNVDYALLAVTYPLLGTAVTAMLAGVLVVMDLLQSALPGYNLSTRTLVESVTDVVAFPLPVMVLGALIVLGVLGLLAWGASRASARSPGSSSPARSCWSSPRGWPWGRRCCSGRRARRGSRPWAARW